MDKLQVLKSKEAEIQERVNEEIENSCKSEVLNSQAWLSLEARCLLINKKLGNGIEVPRSKLRRKFKEKGIRRKVLRHYNPKYKAPKTESDKAQYLDSRAQIFEAIADGKRIVWVDEFSVSRFVR